MPGTFCDLSINRFCLVPTHKSTSEKDSDPTLQGHAGAHAGGLRQKSAFAQPINDNGRGVAIPKECEIPQKTQIARLQIALQPGAH
jgi:hypothetical protein